MMSKKSLAILTLLAAFSVATGLKTQQAKSAASDHVVISEIQIAGSTASDEFIELYNPTNIEINLADWRLTRKTEGGTESNLVSSFDDPTMIPAYGYLLVTHADYDGAPAADVNYSATTNSISANNTILLYSDAGVTLVDKVGMGSATDVEAAATIVPATDMSIERKAHTASNATSMSPGGMDVFEGNSEDTDNNSSDFVETSSHPQNSASMTEMMGAADQTVVVFLDGSFEIPEVITDATGDATVALDQTANTYRYAIAFSDLSATQSGAHIHGFADDSTTASVLHDIGIGNPAYGMWNYNESDEADIVDSLTYINIHSEDYPDGEIRGQVEFSAPSPTPTLEPTASPTPTETPSPTPEPTEEPTPTPTTEPTSSPSPTMEPTPTTEPTPSVEPTVTPSPSPTPQPHPDISFWINQLHCHTHYFHFHIFGRTISFPHVVCH